MCVCVCVYVRACVCVCACVCVEGGGGGLYQVTVEAQADRVGHLLRLVDAELAQYLSHGERLG